MTFWQRGWGRGKNSLGWGRGWLVAWGKAILVIYTSLKNMTQLQGQLSQMGAERKEKQY